MMECLFVTTKLDIFSLSQTILPYRPAHDDQIMKKGDAEAAAQAQLSLHKTFNRFLAHPKEIGSFLP